VELAVQTVRDLLGMDVAYSSQITDSEQILTSVQGDRESFGVGPGTRLPLEQTYCNRVLKGRLPNIIQDVRAEDRASSLAMTRAADVGAFASVPIRFSDGRLYGTLCAASHEAKCSLGYRDLQFLHAFARMVADILERDSLAQEARRLAVQAASLRTLIGAIDARDSYTGAHSRQVVKNAGAVARCLGLSDSKVTDVEQVALLHDVGKIAVPDSILSKPGPLTDEEWEVMRSHPVKGEQLVRDTQALAHLASAVRAEHERWDGRGYPDGLAGREIPIASRVTFVCDAYDAMTSDRPYRRALTRDAARAELHAGTGSQFCPKSTSAFLSVLDE
jgi:HD domain-containing protein/GAF domain-containing protein